MASNVLGGRWGVYGLSGRLSRTTWRDNTLIRTPSESFEAHDNVASVFAEPDAASVTIPDAHLLFTADFKRKGSDLVLTGDDGHKILVTDYFRHEKQPDLVSPEGALLSASVVELLAGSAAPGQYAQATAPAAQQPVGRVETVSGSATVTRNGVAVDLNVGDLVFQGDVVQTRSDSTLGIGFADGSAFSLKENARMALNEFVYDPNSTSNSALINLVQGTVSFIASQVAKTGNMRVETPTATLGIRGTFVTVDVSSVDGHTVASLGLETNLTTGEQFAGAFTLTNRITGNAVNVSSVNSMFSVSPNGSIGESTKPPAIAAIEQASFQALSAIAAATAASMGTAPTGPTGPTQFLNDPNSPSGTKTGDTGPGSGPASGGSSGANTAPTNTSPTDNSPTKITLTPTTAPDTTPANTGGTGTTPTNNNTNQPTSTTTSANTSQHITPTGTVTNVTDAEAATHQIGSFSLLEHVSITNPGPSANYVSGSATLVSATVPGGLPSTLTSPAFLSSLLTIAPDGTVGYDRSNFAFLGAGQSLTYAIAFDVQSGSDTIHLTLTLTVNGANEAPTIIIGAADAAAATVTDDTHATNLVTHGTLSFKDPDSADAHSVSVAVKSGHAIGTFLAGVLVDTAGSDPATSAAGDIGWVFAANKPYVQSLAAGQTDTEVFTITLNDGQGGTVSQDVSVTVVGVNDAPTITSAGAAGSLSERVNTTNDTADKDQASGTIAFADPDLSDTHTVTQAAPTFTWSGGTLTAAQQAALTAAGTLTFVKVDSTGTGSGSVAWTYKITDSALDFVAAGETLTATYNVTINDGHGGTVTQPVTVTMTGTNDGPTIAAGTTATGHIVAAPQDDAAPLTALAASYLTAGHNLLNGPGGSSGFGESDLARGDDNSSGQIDITSVFGAAGLNFFGHSYTSLYINNNGNITFSSPTSQFTPSVITGGTNNPIIAPFWADVDTRGGVASATPGGNSTGVNLVHYDLDTTNGVMTVTWDDVGYFSQHKNLLDAFQVQLINVGNGDFEVVFRYEDINWTKGDASGGSGGLGGHPARAGYSAGDGVHYFELPQSGNQAQMLALESTTGNTGIAGVDVFEVRNGDVVSNLTRSGTILFSDADLSDTHSVGASLSSAVRSAGGDIPAATQADLANALITSMTSPNGHDSTATGSGAIGWVFNLPHADTNFLTVGETLTVTYNVTVDDHNGGTVTQPVTVTITNTTPTISVAISGTAQEGSTLNANTTTNDPDATIHYQWQFSSDGGDSWHDISGATGKFYAVAESDETHLLRVHAWTSDPNNSTASATSNATAAVTDVTPTLTVPFSYAIDELKIVKTVNGTPTIIYDNTFDQAPPQSPNILSSGVSSPIQFITSGTWAESDGKAIMSATGVVPLTVNDNVSAILNTNSQPQSTSSLGLKENGTFTVSATFDLANPASFTGYGFALTDGTSTHASDEVAQLVVQRMSGNVVVNLYKADFTNTSNPFTLVASQSISEQLAGNNQIELTLNHAAGSTVVTGSFTLMSGGHPTSTTTFGDAGQQVTIFTPDVTWTRPQIFSFATPTTVTITDTTSHSSTVREGDVLTVNAATNDADATIHYHWQRSDDGSFSAGHITNIGSDTSTYTVVEADEGSKIRVVANTADLDNTNTPATATSAATATVKDALPTITS